MTERTHKPLISVIMPVYNAGEFLQQSITSVLTQSLTQFELIIVDDGSSDDSQTHIAQWCKADSRVKSITHNKNLGVWASRNAAISAAQCQYLAFVDADDTWHKDKLAIQYQYHQSTRCAFSCTAFEFGNKTVRAKPIITYRDLLANNTVNTSSVMLDSQQVTIEFTNMDKSEDYQQWLSVAKQHNIHTINQSLVNRRAYGGVSSDKLAMIRQRWHIYRNVEKLSRKQALYYFAFYAFTGLKKYWRLKTG